MSIITNPELMWDGETEVRAGRHIERPSGWTVTIADVDNQPPPWIHHKPQGFNLDANHIRTQVTYAQDITIPAGEHYVIVHNISHLTWGSDDYTVAWRVEVAAPSQTYRSENVWFDRQKGDQSFAVCVKTPQDIPATLRVTFWTKWADTNGSVNLRKIDVQPESWGLPVRDTLTLPGTRTIIETIETDESDVTATTTVTTTSTSPTGFSQALGVLSDGMAECADLIAQDADPATVARCFRRLASAFNDAAATIEDTE